MLALLAPAAGAQQPAPGSAAVVDGPSSDIVRPSGLAVSVARDGSGGLVYLKLVGGTPHVFVSQLVGGSFQTPVQVDSGLAGGSAQPVIAAGNGGALLVGFVNGGELYVVDRPSQAVAFGSPIGLAGGASNPAISMSNFGKAYLAFTAADGAGSDVRTAYYDNGRWALEGPPLNAVAADDAGTGSGRPDVATAGDGVAIVVWGESGHVYSRRVWATSPSVVVEQADSPPTGCTEASADAPAVGAGGDSSFAAVAFHELVTCNGEQQSRVLVNRLHASIYDGISNADGLSGAPADGAGDPQVVVTEYGQGFVTSERTVSNSVFAQTLYQNTQPGGVTQVNSLPAAAPPYPVPAVAGLYSTLIAWQQEPGASGAAEIRVRYAPDGYALGPEMVVSSPAQGPVDASDGLAAAGDVFGEAAVAWLQGTPGATAVMVEQLYQPPGPFALVKTARYVRTSQPRFSWTRPHGWGPLSYSLTVDGATVAQTYANSGAPSASLSDGPHTWQVLASNPGGQQSRTRSAPVFVDTVAPAVKLGLRVLRLAGVKLHAKLSYADLPPAGEPASDASGVARVVILWGDGAVTRLRLGAHRTDHVYRRVGRYRITVLVSDRAGNVTRVVMKLKIVKSLSRTTQRRHRARPKPPATGGTGQPQATTTPQRTPTTTTHP
jgi:hypothetical protein